MEESQVRRRRRTSDRMVEVTAEDRSASRTSNTPDIIGDPSTRHSASITRSPSSAVEQYKLLRSVAIGLIDQAIDLLHHVVVSDGLLSSVSELVPGSTIGKHLRHLHDHFRILFECALSGLPGHHKVLNYDTRERNVPMESSHKTILAEFERLKHRYLGDPESPLNVEPNAVEPFCENPSVSDRASSPSAHPSTLSSSSSSLSLAMSRKKGCSRPRFDHDMALDLVAITPHRVGLKTTFNRELWFACLHATHHYALIRVIVTGELKLSLPKEFGVAPSTLERSKM
ncbi:hypothetical protein PGTUg99_004467 [Puccinia graminis f. sp. tritici]|uniref:Uncharacterized protein n=2 Tax=Puccinia graminis f. sp. tritici TaxID=56615 RepID=A0A5B0NPC9_PUCGR|nr:hypothetical protein PGTUg99_004467 [Puccinia graminis f. sp. tritici]